ncbi:hypothetical protein DH2020_017415 [Rehmannia glutinosa]|uniref:Serine carboxypeptidase-like protein n=1 Tax=Rehmannia glutinosa TaxID=99300 RepID=A0ABR0WUK5_REHGL
MDVVLIKLVLLIVISLRMVCNKPLVDARYWHRSYEKQSNIEDLVTNLPGQPGVNFRHYAGYVTVNEQNGRSLFYWFYEATNLADEKPLVLWLNGGPGCSSVGYGATQEIGPFLVDTDGRALKFNSFSWNTGKYVPELAEIILDKNKDPSLFIDLRGILLGNPETYDAEDWKGMVDYAWSHAVVSDETHQTILQSCDFYSDDTWNNSDCSAAVEELLSQYKEIDIYSLYTSVCIVNSSGSEKKSSLVTARTSSKMMPRVMGGYDPCLDDYTKSYYNRPDVQKALHVSDGIRLRNWSICNMTVFDGWSDSKGSVLPIYKKLIDAHLRIWVYSGDTDGRVPVLSTRYSLSSLGLPIKTAWRPWYHQKQYDGLTFATFRGAGHAVPIFKPSESLAFFASFLAGESPPSQR